ncbi:hypothetical protein SE17_37695 [Kouleothrix aurantiaca]|uniref:DUF1579 domain-containing protein n=1 Tax=Kouleothrix aurantiaca TaxID=186479 RepID=A0A0P9H3C8_9CHLR|nr:hypothetical protein SE17_37695 [Kouleothrix aurantiaca]
MSTAEKHAALFAGRWVGETQGYDAPAHIWEITQNGPNLAIDTRWEGESRSMRLHATALADEPAIMLGETKAVLVGAQHFVIRGWDTNDTRGGVGPHYDVVFARPGLAELQSAAMWEAFNAANPLADE